MSKTDEFRKKNQPKVEEEKISEEPADEDLEKIEAEEDEEDEEDIEAEEEKEPLPKPEKKPERIVLKQAVSMDKPKRHSWMEFEAPDKNGQKIKNYQGKAAVMKEKLLEQEEIITFIPHEPGTDKSVPAIVNLNGYKLNIPRNTYVSLPRQVHEVIRNAHQQVELAYAEMERRYGINRNEKTVDALL